MPAQDSEHYEDCQTAYCGKLIQTDAYCEAHSPAAVVSPWIWLRLVTMIDPAPRNPTPLITCAAIRLGSTVS